MNYANHWIRLSDELPPFDTPVFFTTRDSIRIGEITSDDEDGYLFVDIKDCPSWWLPDKEWACCESEIDPYDDFEPTHWLPFPEPRRVDG